MNYEDGYLFWCKFPKPKDGCFLFVAAKNTGTDEEVSKEFARAEAVAKSTAAVESQYSGFCRRVVSRS